MTAIPGPGRTSRAVPAISRAVPTRNTPPRLTALATTCSNGSTRPVTPFPDPTRVPNGPVKPG